MQKGRWKYVGTRSLLALMLEYDEDNCRFYNCAASSVVFIVLYVTDIIMVAIWCLSYLYFDRDNEVIQLTTLWFQAYSCQGYCTVEVEKMWS